MTDDHEGLPPESYVPIFELGDHLVTASRSGVATAIAGGWYGDAFALMRYQLQTEAIKRLRAAGCAFRRSDQMFLVEMADDPTITPDRVLAVEIEEATAFLAKQDAPLSVCEAALEILRQLAWLGEAIRAASTEDRELVRRVGLVSCVMGFNSAATGIEGVIPSLAELEDQAKAARKAADGGDKGRHTRRKAAETWKVPLRAFAQKWVERHTVRHGSQSQIITDFRVARPEVKVPASDTSVRFVGDLLREWGHKG